MNREGSYLGNLLLPLVVFGIAGLLFFLSFDFPDQGEEVGAGSVPQLWMLCTAVLCVVLIINALLKRGSADPIPGNIWFVFGFAAWMALYLFAIEFCGYFLSTFFFLVGSMYMMGYRRPIVSAIVAGAWLIFSYAVFVKFLYIPLPVGPLGALIVGGA